MMTNNEAVEIAAAIMQNEGRFIAELTDLEICGYLVDRNIEETAENIAAIRAA